MLCPESGLVVVASSRKVRSKVQPNAVKHCTGRLYIFLLALKLYHLVYRTLGQGIRFHMHRRNSVDEISHELYAVLQASALHDIKLHSRQVP